MGDINSRHSHRRNSQFRISIDQPGKQGNVLVKATSPKYGEFLVLNELQLRYKPEMPKRMRAYAALAEEKYYLPIKERLLGIELALEVRFGAEGLELIPEISQISDLELLKNIQKGVLTVNTLNELQKLMQNMNSTQNDINQD